MGYDLQRAALVTCCLSALLLAASLMPAAGLGSFPTVGGPGSGDAVTVPDDAPDLGTTPAEQTTTAVQETTEEATPVATETTEPEADEPETTAPVDDDPDEGSTLLGMLGGLAGLLLVGALAGGVGYTGVVLVSAVAFGAEAVQRLPFSGTITAIPTLTMSSLIGAAGVTGSFLGQLRSVGSSVGDGMSALARVPGELGRVVGAAVTGPVKALGAVSLGAGSLFGSLSNLSIGLRRRGSHTEAAATTTDARETGDAPTPTDGEDGPPPEPTSVVDAFDRMTDRLPISNSEARTPAELADAAVERGWPSGPVETLTDLFREVRYGGRADDSERTGRAASALARLREFWGGSR